MNDYSDTKEFILKQASEHDVKFIRLWFTDILGRLKGFAINIEDLEVSLISSKGFDLSESLNFCGCTFIKSYIHI